MTLVASFIALSIGLAVVSWWRGNLERALAFAFVAAGLLIMAVTAGNAGGVVAFAVWTIVSYLLLNFPVAATLYLLSAFCYILELQGQWLVAIQVASNIAGLLGLLAVHFGNPKWRYIGIDRVRGWGGLAVDFNVTGGGSRVAQRNEAEK